MRMQFFIVLSSLFFVLVWVNTGCRVQEDRLDLYEKGKSLYLSQNLEQAIPYFERAISAQKSFKQAYIMLAKCHYYTNREGAALKTLQAVLKINPDYLEANYWTGKIYYFLEEYKKAKKYLLKVVDEDSNHIDARYLLGNIYLAQGLWDKALANYDVIEANLDLVALAKIKKAEIYRFSGQSERALGEISFINKNKEIFDSQVINEAYSLLSKLGTEGEGE